MHRSTLSAVAAVAVALVLTVGDAAPAAAQAAPGCAPSDLGCALVAGLDGALAPVVPPPPTTTATTGPTPAAPTTDAPPGQGAVAGASVGAVPAELAGEPVAVPSVPVGQALELPPLSLPDFGPPPAPDRRGAARMAAPRPVEVAADPAPGRPAPSGTGAEAARAVGLAVGVPAVLVAVSVAARRRSAARAAA